jgi:Carboxypeptidase regulatory-like domain/TonB dependent receptor-like, beta-barrel
MVRWAAVLSLLLCPTFVIAATGTVAGRVTDPSGAVIVNASVTLRNASTSVARTTATNSRGEYSFFALPPGTYELQAEASGYARASVPIDLQLDQSQFVELSMQIAPHRETVNATAVIKNEAASWGAVISQSEMDTLPLNEHNFLAFALLAPGAQMGADGSQLSCQGGGTSVSGGREQANNFLLDGTDNNDDFIRQYSALAPLDSVQEFKVQSSGSDVEFGGNSGGQIDVVLKSGGNSFHGSAFEYLRNRHLDAKNYFDLPQCSGTSTGAACGDIPGLDRNQFGGTLGGPIRPDRTFFFVSYEGMILRQATTREATVPSQVQRAAALSAVPEPMRNPAGLAVFNLLPAANVGPDLSTSNLFISAPIIRNAGHHLSLKLDDAVSVRDQLAFHYVFANDDRFNPFDPLLPPTSLPGYGSNAWDRGHNAGLTWVHVLQSSAVNEARIGFNRHIGLWTQQHSGQDLNHELGFPDVITRPVDLGLPLVTIAGFDGIGEPRNLPQGRHDDTLVASDNLTWRPGFNRGRHETNLGGSFTRFRYAGYLDVMARGQWFFMGAFTGNPLQDLLLGLPTYALGVSGDTNAVMSTTGSSLYAQDHWRLSDNVALTLGVRWEFATPPVEAHDRISVPDLSSVSATCSPQPDCQFIRAGTNGIPRATYGGDYNDVAPRLGLAWRPLRNSQLALRAGYGIYYSTGMMSPSFFPRVNPPMFTTKLYYNFGTSNVQSIISQPAVPQPAIAVMVAPDHRDPYVQQWRLEVQQGGPSASASVAYVGSKGTALLLQRNMNQSMPGGANPYPQFGPIELISSSASSIYHSLQAQGRLQKKGLTLQTAYTFSRSIDDASAFFGADGEPGIPQNSYDLGSERGLSSFQAKHRLVTTLAYQLPAAGNGLLREITNNWSMGSIIVMQSGRPFTVNRAIDQSHDGTATLGYFADRPNQVSDPFRAGPVLANPDPPCQLTISQGGRAADRVRTAETWFNPCAFADPGMGFGNAGRNSVIGPGLDGIDLSLERAFQLGETSRLQCRVEVFNATNHSNFDLPDRSYDSGTFGHLVSANRNGMKPPRQVQVAVRYSF